VDEISWRRNAGVSAVITVVVFVSGFLLTRLSEDDADGKALPSLDVHADEAIVTFVVYPLWVFASVFVLLAVVSWVKRKWRR